MCGGGGGRESAGAAVANHEICSNLKSNKVSIRPIFSSYPLLSYLILSYWSLVGWEGCILLLQRVLMHCSMHTAYCCTPLLG